MELVSQETCPLPDDPALAAAAAAFNEAGHTAQIVDPYWRVIYMTDENRLIESGLVERVALPLGVHMFGGELTSARLGLRGGAWTRESMRGIFEAMGPNVLADTPGGRDELREVVDPMFRDIVDGLSPAEPPPVRSFVLQVGFRAGRTLVGAAMTLVRIRGAEGTLAGTAIISKPAVGMAMLTALAAGGDLRHFERMLRVAKPERRPAAILFADLDASSPLARHLSTASYFALGRRLVRAADQCIIDSGGLVGRHVGDGVVAFFLTEISGSDSSAARACITAARALRTAIAGVAARSDLQPEDVVMRFGLHWGSTLYVGNITTAGRTEVNALGDEVNEAARIEACATGGRALASKALIERLQPADAAALDLDPKRGTYTALADLDTATEKARRDAPAIAVCEV